MSKHTQGRWVVELDDNCDATYCLVSAYERLNEMSLSDDEEVQKLGRAEELANARLIAEAPEMLELLREIVEYGERGSLLNQSFDKAIELIDRIDKGE